MNDLETVSMHSASTAKRIQKRLRKNLRREKKKGKCIFRSLKSTESISFLFAKTAVELPPPPSPNDKTGN